MSDTIKMPDGLVVPTKDTIYQYAAIIYDNGWLAHTQNKIARCANMRFQTRRCSKVSVLACKS